MFSMAFGDRGDMRVVRTDAELNKDLSDIRSGKISVEP
jgi:hypothetical protein